MSDVRPEIQGKVEDVRARLRNKLFGDPLPSEVEDKPRTSWADVNAQLDPNMPQEQYDAIRQRYFVDQVAPRVRRGYSVADTYQEFLKKTERPKALSSSETALVKTGQLVSSAVKAMAPGMGLTKELDDAITPMADRDGIKSPVLETVGQAIGMGINMEALLPIVGAGTAALIPKFIQGQKAAAIASKVARGGLAFGIYDALAAEDGDRVNAGLRGAALGSLFEVGIGAVFGFGEKATQEAVKDTINNTSLAVIPKEGPYTRVQGTVHVRGDSRYPMRAPISGLLSETATPETKLLGSGVYEMPESPMEPAINAKQAVEEHGFVEDLVQIDGVYQKQLGNMSRGEMAARDPKRFVAEEQQRRMAETIATSGSMESGQAFPGLAPLPAKVAPPAEGLVRLYRGVPKDATGPLKSGKLPNWITDSSGKWFTDNTNMAKAYAREGGSISYVDVPKEAAASWAVEGRPNEFLLPDVAVKASMPMQAAVTEAEVQAVTQAKKLGYLVGPMRETGRKGLTATLRDAEGNTQMLPIARGKEGEAIGLISELLQKGGSMDMLEFHPASKTRAIEIMRHFADIAEGEDFPLRMMVNKGEAGEMAAQLNKMGLRGTVVSDSTLLVGPEAPWVRAQRAKKFASAFEEMKAQIAADDAIGQKLARIGDIRNRVILSGEGEGPAVPRAEHAEMHHLAGELGSEYGLTRAQVGQIALEAVAKGDGKALLEKFAGSGEKFGAKAGEAVPPGWDVASRLPGYKKGDAIMERGGQVLGVIPESEVEGFTSRVTPREAAPPREVEGVRSSRGKITEVMAPASERTVWEGTIRERPVGRTKVVKKLPNGYRAMAISTEEGPLRVIQENATRGDLYHERTHVGMMTSGADRQLHKLMPEGAYRIGKELSAGVKKLFPTYTGIDPVSALNEAFVHAAEAIRFNDTAMLEELSKFDGSVEDIKGFVNQTAGKLLEHSRSGEGAVIRQYQRALSDLVRRTDNDVAVALRKASQFGWDTWFDPELGQWVMRDGEGRTVLKKEISEVWDHVHQYDPSDHFPDSAGAAYFKGVKGPIVPEGTEPIGEAPTPELVDLPWGWIPVSSRYKPTLDAAARVQSFLDKHGFDVPVLKRFQAVDKAWTAAGPRIDELTKARNSILKGVSSSKQQGYAEVLSYKNESQWAAVADKYKLDAQDMSNIRMMKTWAEDIKARSNVDMIDGLETMRAVRAGTKLEDLPDGLWKTAITHGSISPKDLNAGRVSQYVIRKSIDLEYMNKPLGEVEDLLKIKGPSGKPLLGPVKYMIDNHLNYMRGIPDASQEAINFAVSKFFPEKFFGPHKEILRKYMLALYVSGLGARPVTFIRDIYNGAQTFAAMGPTAFAEGMKLALTKEGRAKAEAVLLKGRDINEFMGDITGTLSSGGKWSQQAVRIGDALLAPSRWGNNVNRYIAYLGEEARSTRALKRYLVDKDLGALTNSTGLAFLDAPVRSDLLARAATMKGPEEIAALADEIGKSFNDATNFAMRHGTQPALLKTGAGRLFGQYATWPANFIQYSRKMSNMVVENPKVGIPAAARWLGTNYAAYKAAEALGVTASNWLFFSPAAWSGSPNLELLGNILAAPSEDERGLQARHDILRFGKNLVPAGVQLDNLYDAFEEGDLSLPRLLGFKPKKGRDLELDEWLAKESGIK